jgi:hypothetical protein
MLAEAVGVDNERPVQPYVPICATVPGNLVTQCLDGSVETKMYKT